MITELAYIRVICRFLDVFPEELPGLPSNQEIKFEIELFSWNSANIQGTQPGGSSRIEGLETTAAGIAGQEV